MKFLSFLAMTGLFLFIMIGAAKFGKGLKKMKEGYLKADTTITIRNGHPDTVITKKSKPWWME